jgi:RimJ/RimL family protein N-acetyltransferase
VTGQSDISPPAIGLEPLEPHDFPLIRSWIDPRVFRIFHDPVDDDQLRRLLTSYDDGRPRSLGYRIVRCADTEIIGLIHAIIDWKNDLAHIGQLIVGDPDLRGRGIGAAALRLFLPICFEELGLHRAQIFVDEDNQSAIACYEKVGFKREGLMREATKTAEGYVSWYSMSILAGEWRARLQEEG